MAQADDSGRERNEDGQYADRIPAETALEVFERREDVARPLTATEVMESLDCSRRTAHDKLNELVDRDLLATRKVGARSRVWWVPIRDDSAAVSSGESGGDEDPENLAVARAVERVDLPGTGPLLDRRRAALRAAYDYLVEYSAASKQDFVADVYPDNPAGYETGDGWWNAVRPALGRLPGVDPPSEHATVWRFLDDG